MKWERFERGRRPRGLQGRVTIYKSGLIGIGKTLLAQIGLGEFAELYLDRDGRHLGIKPVAAEQPFTYRVYSQGATLTRCISIKGALAELGCSIPARAIHPPVRVENGLLVVDCSALAEEAPSDGN